MNDISLTLKKQHISAKVYSNYLLYLKKNYPGIDLKELVESCGLDLSYLSSSSAWVSTTFDRNFTRRCLELTQEKDFVQNVSAFAVSREGLPAPFFLAIRLISTVSFLYVFLVQKIFPSVNRVINLRVVSERSGFFEIEMAPILAGLSEGDASALVDNFSNIVDSTVGYFKWFPVLLNMPAAKVRTTVNVDPAGSPYCRMAIDYFNHNALIVTSGYFFSAVLSLGSFIIIKQNVHLAIAVPASAIWVVIAVALRAYSRLKGIQSVSNEAQKSYADLQNQYSETYSAKVALDRSLREQDVVNSLLRTLIRAKTASDVIKEGCNFLVESFGFERVVVLHLNESKDRLVYNYGSSTRPEALEFFSQLTLPTEIESTDLTKLTNVFRFRKSLLIEDCTSHLKTLTDEGRQFLQASNSISFIAVPIVANDRCFGIFVIDAFEKRRRLTERDLLLAEKVANAVAAALEKSYLQAAREEALERSNKFKDQILANTSHELRTPINGVVNFARIVRDSAGSRLTKSEIGFLNAIEQAGNRLGRLVNNILEQSVQNYGNLSLTLEPVNVYEISCTVVAEIEIATERRSVIILLDDSMKSMWVLADRDKLFQVLVNLLQNALKFTQRGRIVLSAENDQGFVRVSVTDTGSGIAAADRERIFEPFVKAESTMRQDGVGLGLAITKTLVTKMGGRIWVEDGDSSTGTRMTFSLPVANNISSELEEKARLFFQAKAINHVYEEVKSSLSPQEHKSFVTTEPKVIPQESVLVPEETVILVVDDEAINVAILSHFLEAAKFRVVSAPDGQTALKLIDDGLLPSLVLLDIMMPGIDGYEVCSQLRKLQPAMELPIIMMSAKQEVDDVLRGFNCGANDYLGKPFVKEILLARVVSHLGVSYMSRVASRFVPWELVGLLGAKDLSEIEVGKGAEFEIAVFYLDLRKFTELLEAMPCSDAFHFLNSFLGHVVPRVIKHNGVVDKYIGDCVLGVFLSADQAIAAAIEVQESMKGYNLQHRSGGNRRFVDIGIAIHWGKAFVGSVGISKRLEITVVSDAVNTGSRLQELTKTYGAEIIASQAILDRASPSFAAGFRYIDDVLIRGRKEKVRIYSVRSQEAEESRIGSFKIAS